MAPVWKFFSWMMPGEYELLEALGGLNIATPIVMSLFITNTLASSQRRNK
jgi:hypothetical protein